MDGSVNFWDSFVAAFNEFLQAFLKTLLEQFLGSLFPTPAD